MAVRAVLLLVLCPLAAAAAPVGAVMRLLDATVIHVHANGQVSELRTLREQAQTVAGAEHLAELKIPYNAQWDRFKVLAAAEILPHGGYAVPQVHTVRALPYGIAPAYRDERVAVIAFRDLAPGAIVQVSYREDYRIQDLPGAFGVFRMFDRTQPLRLATVTVHAPAWMKFGVQENNGALSRTDHDGEQTIYFKAARVAPLVDVASVSERLRKSPYFALSLYHSPEQALRAYAAKLLHAERITLELQHLADRLAGQRITPEGLMHRYYRWINAHIRLIDIPLRLDNTVPRTAQQILLSGYGTPQDRVILLQALMHAKAIRTMLVLVPSWPVHWRPLIEPMPAFLGRLMLSADDNQVPLDIGSTSIALGEYAPDQAGAWGYSVGPDGGVQPIQVPMPTVDQSINATATRLRIGATGMLSGTATIADYGMLGVRAQQAFLLDTPSALRARVTAAAGALATDVSVQPGRTRKVLRNRAYVYHATLHPVAFIPAGQTRAVTLPRPATSLESMTDFMHEHGAGLCQQTVREERTTVQIAGGEVVGVPHNVSVVARGGIAHYRATYTRAPGGHVLYVDRMLTLQASPDHCTPAQQRAILALSTAVRRDLDARLTITLPPQPTGKAAHG